MWHREMENRKVWMKDMEEKLTRSTMSAMSSGVQEQGRERHWMLDLRVEGS